MKTIRLTQGLGEKGKSHCVMAATSIVANEPFSDKPLCVCPTITAALIKLNDSYGADDATREEAMGHLPWLIIGTRGTKEIEKKRALLFADWAVRVCCGIKCEPITNQETAHKAATAAAHTATHAYNAHAANAAAHANAANAAYSAKAAAYAAHAANAAAKAAAYAAYAAANAACGSVRDYRQDLIDYIESTIIPVCTTMPIEPGFRSECLITNQQ